MKLMFYDQFFVLKDSGVNAKFCSDIFVNANQQSMTLELVSDNHTLQQ